MHRRALLSAGAALAVGGCLGLGRSPGVELAAVWLENERPARQEVDLRIEDDGETVFSDAYHLPAADTEPTETGVTDTVDGRGRYRVRLTRAGTTHDVEPASALEGDGDCATVRYTLRDDGTVDESVAPGEC